MKHRIAIVIAVILGAAAVGAVQTRPPAQVPPPVQVPPMPPPAQVPPAMPPGMVPGSTSSPSIDVYLLAGLRAQDARIEALEKRLAAVEKKLGVK